jgi:hypothetical protein
MIMLKFLPQSRLLTNPERTPHLVGGLFVRWHSERHADNSLACSTHVVTSLAPSP